MQEQQKTAGEYFASSLDKHTVIAAAWLYGNNCLKLNDEQLAAAKALVMDDAQRYPQNVILALTSLKQFAHTYPEMPITAISGMKAIWPPFGKVPELGKLCQFATEYLDATVEQRASVITKWQTSAAGGAKPAETVPEEAIAHRIRCDPHKRRRAGNRHADRLSADAGNRDRLRAVSV